MTVSRISLTRPQMAQQVTELLVRMGQQGQIRGKVTDEALKGLLTQVGCRCIALKIADKQVSGPAPASKPASSAPVSARTKTLGGGITVSQALQRSKDSAHHQIQRKGDDSDSDEYDL